MEGCKEYEASRRIDLLSLSASGKNSEYLYHLHKAVQELCPDSQDVYLEELTRRVRALDEQEDAEKRLPN